MLLEALQNPLVIAVVVLILLLLIAIPVVVRRRRASQEEVLPPPELGQSIDYTSLPYEEPNGLGDRFARASLPTKLLLVLVPLVLIIGVAVVALTFLRSPIPGETPTPAAPAATITNVTAGVAGPAKILVKADTTLPNGSTVAAALKENGQDFAWFNPNTATAEVADGRISLTMDKLKSAPAPRQGQEYTVVLTGTQGGQTISSDPAKLAVPSIYQGVFYQAVAATGTEPPTTAPTEAATSASSAPAPTPPAPAPPTPTLTPTTTLSATVANGGNIRQDPSLRGAVLGQLHAGEVVTLIEKTTDGQWYHVAAPEATGWVSASLLRVDRAVADQVKPAGSEQPAATPTGLTAKVFNGGNVREQPNLRANVLDQINAGETVQLLAKTRDGIWYKITNTRGKTGWVSRTLLTIAPDVIARVPISS